MPSTSDKARRRALKANVKAEERAQAQQAMVLSREQLESLIRYVDTHLEEAGCAHSLMHTLAWARATQVMEEGLPASLGEFGGYCDCEVVLNVDPDEIFGR